MNFIETLTDEMIADLRFRLGLSIERISSYYITILGYKRVTAEANLSRFLISEQYIPIVRNELHRRVYGFIPIANEPFDSISTDIIGKTTDFHKDATMYEIHHPGFCYIKFAQ